MSTERLPDYIQALVSLPDSCGARTVEVHEIPFGGTEKVRNLSAKEIIVKIRAIGLNPTDWKLAIGPWAERIPPGERVVGYDAAGDVVRVGQDVEHLKVGDRVAASQIGCYYHDTGSFAQYSRFDSAAAFKLPESMDYEAGAGMISPIETAMQALYGRLGLRLPSEHDEDEDRYILIWGAATAVGNYAVQLATFAGLKVICTASTKNHSDIHAIGAIACVDYSDPDVVSKLKAAAARHPITLGIDCVGADGSSDYIVDAMTEGGHFIQVMPSSDAALAHAKEKNIKSEFILAGTLFGYEFFLIAFGYAVPIVPGDYDLLKRWTSVEMPFLFEQKALKTLRLRLLPGGLHGVVNGLEIMKLGNYGAEKLVYHIDCEPKRHNYSIVADSESA